MEGKMEGEDCMGKRTEEEIDWEEEEEEGKRRRKKRTEEEEKSIV